MFQPRILYMAKLSFKNKGKIKTFLEKKRPLYLIMRNDKGNIHVEMNLIGNIRIY
jgi:hypothetical protein